MVLIAVVALAVIALLSGFGWLMWCDGGWQAVAFVYGCTLGVILITGTLVILGVQGAYEMGWCSTEDCRVW